MFNHRFATSLILLGLLLTGGCENLKDDDTIVSSGGSTVVNQNTLKPVGTISGKIVDRHTEKPVGGAIVSVGFNGTVVSVTTDISGSFSFANVPCNKDAKTNIITGTYHLTVSLVEVNKTLTANEPKYREYYINNTLTVTFIDITGKDSAIVGVPVEGLEANIRFDVAKLNTTINGSVVNEQYNGVSGATVYLEEATTGDVIQTVLTDANGNYSFPNVEGGTSVFIEARSSDRMLQGSIPFTLNLNINKSTVDLRQQVNAERIVITHADNVAPYVTMITPENLSDVAPGSLVIVYKFSEPIKQTPYTVTNAPLGLGTLIDDIHVDLTGLKKSSGNTALAIAWDTTFTMLTITPRDIVGSAKYQVTVSAALAKLQDRAGNGVTAKPITGDFESFTFTTNGSAALPAAPNLVRRTSSGLGFASLNFTGGTVGLEWNQDVNARSYRIYKSVNGESYKLLADNVMDTRYNDATGNLVSSYAPPGDREPYAAFSVSYKVHGISKDLFEGAASNVLTVKDEVAPLVLGATVDSSVGITAGDYIYLQFSEPLTKAAAQDVSSYQIVNSGGGENSVISEVIYLGYDNISGRYRVRFTVTKGSIETNDVIIANSPVVDLAGNAIDAISFSHKF